MSLTPHSNSALPSSASPTQKPFLTFKNPDKLEKLSFDLPSFTELGSSFLEKAIDGLGEESNTPLKEKIIRYLESSLKESSDQVVKLTSALGALYLLGKACEKHPFIAKKVSSFASWGTLTYLAKKDLSTAMLSFCLSIFSTMQLDSEKEFHSLGLKLRKALQKMIAKNELPAKALIVFSQKTDELIAALKKKQALPLLITYSAAGLIARQLQKTSGSYEVVIKEWEALITSASSSLLGVLAAAEVCDSLPYYNLKQRLSDSSAISTKS